LNHVNSWEWSVRTKTLLDRMRSYRQIDKVKERMEEDVLGFAWKYQSCLLILLGQRVDDRLVGDPFSR
jgi:hypothetical protein